MVVVVGGKLIFNYRLICIMFDVNNVAGFVILNYNGYHIIPLFQQPQRTMISGFVEVKVEKYVFRNNLYV